MWVSKIQEICGDYAINIKYNEADNFSQSLIFNSRRNAEIVKHCIEVDSNEEKAADFVDVVRCKDCKYRNTEWCPFMHFEGIELIGYTEDDAFCSCGERKE